IDKVLEELDGEALVNLVLLRQLQRDAHQVKAEESHPSGGVGLFENGSAGQALTAIDDGDVVESEEATFEDIVALAVDLVHPPCEVDEKFVETLLQKLLVADTVTFQISVVDAPDRPRMHRRIQIGELPFVRRNLSVGVLELLEQHHPQVFFRELRIYERQ